MELIILSQLLPNSRDEAWERSTFVKVWRLKQGARPADLPPRMLRGLGVARKADPRDRWRQGGREWMFLPCLLCSRHYTRCFHLSDPISSS